MVKTLGDSAIRAVPGERYLQLIDDLNGPDQTKRQAAQSFLINLAGIQPPTAPLRASAFFYFDDALPLRADLFAATSIDSMHVTYWMRDKHYRQKPVGSLLLPTATRDQVTQTIKRNIRDALDDIAGTPQPISPAPQGLQAAGQPSAWWKSSFTPVLVNPYDPVTQNRPAAQEQILIQQHNQARDQIVEKLYSAQMAQYPVNAVKSPNTLSIPWSIFNESQYLFVLIDQADWKAHKDKGGVKVIVKVHDAGDPSKIYEQSEVEIPAGEFEQNTPISNPDAKWQGTVVWGVHNMSAVGLSPETIARLTKIRDVLKQYEATEKAHK